MKVISSIPLLVPAGSFPAQFMTPQGCDPSCGLLELQRPHSAVFCNDAHPLHSSRGPGSNRRYPGMGLVLPSLPWELNLYLGS